MDSTRSLMAQQLMQVMADSAKWKSLNPLQKQALTEISGIISRILDGGADNAEHWHDIGAYAGMMKTLAGSGATPAALKHTIIPWCSTCGVMQPPHMVHCAEGLKQLGTSLPCRTILGLTCTVCGEIGAHFGLPCPQMTPKATL